ncbi:outer membrane protein [Pseudochelatococcus sp. G4_1912]|uniref:outer membrane protein n=1 Tax=Pseudochelatococcus sp. G4_1912 TaxID=3114288 RepID=UPI0039C66E54
MTFWGTSIAAVGLIAMLSMNIQAHAGDYQLQPEFDEAASSSKALTTPIHMEQEIAHHSAIRMSSLADEELPDAPDLDAIPFLAARDSAIYGRVDVGFGVPFAHEALTANGRFNPTLSGPALYGVGLGYKLGLMLRSEVTAEYRSRLAVQTADGIRAHTSAANVLANIYADIGTWYGVTPYIGVGAGVGWSALSIAGGFRDQERIDFVWGVMGGFGVELTPQVTFDIGYRYLDTGTQHSPVLTVRESGAHDVRIGLRWRFGDATESVNLP